MERIVTFLAAAGLFALSTGVVFAPTPGAYAEDSAAASLAFSFNPVRPAGSTLSP